MEKHRDRVNNVMSDMNSELQPSVELTQSRINEAGELMRTAVERVVEEAPHAVSPCLRDVRETIAFALEGTSTFLKTCTDDLNKDAVEIMAAYDEEATEHKEKVRDIKDSLLDCNKDISSNRFSDVFRLHHQCCVFDQWNKTKGVLQEFHRFTARFFVHGTDKGKEYIVNAVGCLEQVGKNTLRKVKKITEDILDCAGLTYYDYID